MVSRKKKTKWKFTKEAFKNRKCDICKVKLTLHETKICEECYYEFILDEEKFRTALAEKVQGAYYDEGYIYTNVIPREVPVSADTVDIIFTVIEGNPVKIRRIDIVGNDRTKEKVIRRELQIHPGDRFSKAALMRSQREIFILNYFSNKSFIHWVWF